MKTMMSEEEKKKKKKKKFVTSKLIFKPLLQHTHIKNKNYFIWKELRDPNMKKKKKKLMALSSSSSYHHFLYRYICVFIVSGKLINQTFLCLQLQYIFNSVFGVVLYYIYRVLSLYIFISSSLSSLTDSNRIEQINEMKKKL